MVFYDGHEAKLDEWIKKNGQVAIDEDQLVEDVAVHVSSSC